MYCVYPELYTCIAVCMNSCIHVSYTYACTVHITVLYYTHVLYICIAVHMCCTYTHALFTCIAVHMYILYTYTCAVRMYSCIHVLYTCTCTVLSNSLYKKCSLHDHKSVKFFLMSTTVQYCGTTTDRKCLNNHLR